MEAAVLQRSTTDRRQLYGDPHDELQRPLKGKEKSSQQANIKAVQLALEIAEKKKRQTF